MISETELETRMVNNKRFYHTPSGSWLPSVTTITGFASAIFWQNWRERVGEAAANQAGIDGTNLHTLIEQTMKNEPITAVITDKVTACFKGIKPFLKNITPHSMELCLYSDDLRCAGRTDCIGLYNGVMSIIDYKSIKDLKNVGSSRKKYYTQLSAYAYMWNEEKKNKKVKQLVLLFGDASGKGREEITADIKPYLEEFISSADDFYKKTFKCKNELAILKG